MWPHRKKTAITLYPEMEKSGFIIPERAADGKIIMPDISVGMMFSNYLKTIESPFASKFKLCRHTIYQGFDVDAKQYPDNVLPLFRHFVYNIWLPNHAEKYFQERAPPVLEYLQKLLKAS